MIVADTNIIAYLFLESEHSEQAEAALLLDPEWLAPRLWRSEFRNILALYLRQQRLSLQDVLSLMDEAERLMQGNEYEIASTQVLRLANISGRSAYDCEFVALAQEHGVPLVTADRQLQNSFPRTAISLDIFVS